MAWNGYFTFGGTEVINVARTETYAQHAGIGWFKPAYRNDALSLILGDTYTSPLMDDAPWVDSDDLSSYDFYGVYPLDVTGIEDSTASANVVESTQEGGAVQAPRHGTRTVVFSTVLIGGSECAVEFGMRWLKAAINGCGCLGKHRGLCGGTDLNYLSCEPAVDLNYTSGTTTFERTIVDGGVASAAGATPVSGGSAAKPGGQIVNGGGAVIKDNVLVETAPTFDLTECFDPYLRVLHRVTAITGPSVVGKAAMSNGGSAWTVEWTLVAGDPNEYSADIPLVVGFMDPTVSVPYPGDTVPPGAIWDPDGYITTDPSCPVVVYQPVFDPKCPLLIPPPAVPTISPVCFTFAEMPNFKRRTFTIPKQDVSLWSQTVPIITIHTPVTSEVRNLRVQFFDDPGDDATPDDLCDPQGDVVFTYLPPDSIVTFDGVGHLIYIDTPGQGRRRADSVATNSDGGPFDWPGLTCGAAHVVTIDMPQTQVKPVIDLTLVQKAC